MNPVEAVLTPLESLKGYQAGTSTFPHVFALVIDLLTACIPQNEEVKGI